MGTVIRTLIRGYRYLNDEVSDPRTKDYLLIANPWPVTGILAFYLYFIFDLGPKLMENRRPFKLDKVVQLYDVSQIISCAYIAYKALALGWLNGYRLTCEPIDFSDNPRALEISRAVWMYFLVKMFDLVDTVFFVLRKKQNQISFLHVYHHVGMVVGSWAAVKFLPGGHGTLLGLINCIVHVVMYTHYLVMSLKIWKPWWKKYITQIQLLQFVILLLHFGALLWTEECAFPRWPAVIFIPQNLFMIILFSDFYYKAYIKKKPIKKSEQNGVATEVSNGKPKDQ